MYSIKLFQGVNLKIQFSHDKIVVHYAGKYAKFVIILDGNYWDINIKKLLSKSENLIINIRACFRTLNIDFYAKLFIDLCVYLFQ